MDHLLDKNLISTKDASELSGYSPDYLSRLARSKKINGAQVGRTWLVQRDSLLTFMEGQGKHKQELARALARARKEEYRVHTPKMPEPHRVSLSNRFSTPVKSPMILRTSLAAFRHTGFALLAILAVTAGAYAAEGSALAAFKSQVALLASETSEGFAILKSGFADDFEKNLARTRNAAENIPATRASSFAYVPPSLPEAIVVAPTAYASEEENHDAPVVRDVRPASSGSLAFADVGAFGLSVGTHTRDFLRALPSAALHGDLAFAGSIVGASDAIVGGYVHGASAYSAAAPEIPKATMLAFYQVGTKTAGAASAAPALAARAGTSALTAFNTASLALARGIVANELALGRIIAGSSETSARVALAPFTALGSAAYRAEAMPSRVLGAPAEAASALADGALGALGKSAVLAENTEHLGLPAAAAGALPATSDGGFQSAIDALYRFGASVFDTGLRALAFVLEPNPPLAVAPGLSAPAEAAPAPATDSHSIASSSSVAQTTIVNNTTQEFITNGVTKQYVDDSVNTLRELMYENVNSAVSHLHSGGSGNGNSGGSTGGGSGSVTSVDIDGGSTGLSFGGGPITSSGTFTLGGVLGIANGGTGISAAPTYGKLLIGNNAGGYDLVATSSLGITGTGGGGTDTWGSITGTLSDQTDLQNALDSKLSLLTWYATTTDGLHEGTNNLYFTNTRADARAVAVLSATTSLPNITTLANLSAVSTSLTGFVKATAGVLSAVTSIALGSDVSGTLPVANGGTGRASLTANTVLLGNGTGAVATTSAGTNGQVLGLVNGVPMWVATTTLANISGTLSVASGGTGSTTLTGLLKGNGNGAVQTAVAGTDYEVPLTFSTGLNRTGNTITNAGVTSNLSGTGISVSGGTGAVTISNTGVLSFNSRTGAVVPASGDYTTDQITEGAKLYYTNDRVAAVIAGTTTDALAQGSTNKYYADSLVQTFLNSLDKGYFFSTTSANYWKTQNDFFSTTSANYFLSQNTGSAYSTTSANYWLTTKTTDNLAQGSTNKYFSNTLAQGAISVSGAPLTYSAGVIGINQASGSQAGYLSSTDWSLFNNKISSTSLSASSPLSYDSSTGVFGLGTVPIVNGGTGTTTGGVTNGVEYYDGTKLTNSAGFVFDGTHAAIGTNSNFNGALTLNGTIGVQSEGDIFRQYDSGDSTWYPVIARYDTGNGSFPGSTYIFGAGANANVGIEKPGGSNVASFHVHADTTSLSNALTVGSTLQVTGQTTLATSLSGLLKASSGVVSVATAGTDYLAPSALNSYLSLASWYATTTDGLAQGSTNKYYSTSLFAADLAGTTTDALHEGTNNKYFSNALATANFISNLAATTSVASITALPNLSLPLSQTTGTLGINRGGTGTSTAPAANRLLLSDASGNWEYVATSSLGFGTGSGSVTSVDASGGTTGLSFSGGPITSSGTLTLAGTLGAANGGTGSTTLSGILKGNGTGAIQSAVAGTDYAPATSGSSLLYGNGAGGFSNASVSSPLSFTGGALSISKADGSTNGYLSSADWNLFNNKVSSTSLTSTLTGYLSLASWYATTTDALHEGTNNLYFTDARATDNFISNLAGTSSVASITALPNLSLPLSQTTGTLGVANGGTGTTTGGVTNGVEYYDGNNLTNGSNFMFDGTNVGIGSTSPSTLLSIAGSTGNPLARFTQLGGMASVALIGNAGGSAQIDFGDSADEDIGRIQYLNTSDSFNFYTDNANRFTIDSSGNVGVGTTSPFAKLSVAGSAYLGGNLTATGAVAFTGLGSGLVKSTSGTLSVATAGTDYVAPSSLNSYLSLASWYGTTTDGLHEGTNNLYFTSGRATANFVSNLAATTSVASITALPNLLLPLSQTTGTLGQGNGGTGQSSYTPGDILYADNSGDLVKLAAGSDGQVLKLQAGLPNWGVDQTVGGGGSDGIFATSSNKIYPLDTASVVLVGTNATSTANSIFEVSGQAYVSTKLGIATTNPSAALSVGGSGLFSGTVTTAGLNVGSLTGLLKASSGAVSVATDGTDFISPSTFGSSFYTFFHATTTDALAEGTTNKYFSDALATANFISNLAATTSVASITTLPSLSLPYSQLTGTPTNENPLTFTYPLTRSANTISLAFGTSTSNTWGGTQTFTNAPVLGALSGLVYGNNGTLSATATTTLSTSGALSFSANPIVLGSSPISLSLGTVGVANGGTGSTTLTGLLKGNGTGAVQTAVAGTDYVAPSSLNSYLSLASWYATTTDGLAQGSTNKYYSTSLFAADLAGTTTDALHEGTNNKYYTDARVGDYLTGSTTLASFLNYWTKSGSNLSYSAGNVGIGTTTPAEKLSVQGNGLFSGNLSLANLIATGTLSVSGTGTSTFAGALSVAGTDGLHVFSNGNATLGSPTSNAGLLTIYTPETTTPTNGTILSDSDSQLGLWEHPSGLDAITVDANGAPDALNGDLYLNYLSSGDIYMADGGGDTYIGDGGGLTDIGSGGGDTYISDGGGTTYIGGPVELSGDLTAISNDISAAGIHALGGLYLTAPESEIHDINDSTGNAGDVLQVVSNFGVSNVQWVATSTLGFTHGTVTSVDASGGTTGLSFSGGPITSSGTLTLAGTLGAANGGTGSTTLSGLLKGNGTGAVQSAVAGTDYITPAGLASAYPFPLSGNATSTLTQFNGGASTTQLTSTGSAYLATSGGSVGIGTASPTNLLTVLGTTQPQFRLAYDTSNYFTAGVDSNGGTTLSLNGTTGGLIINNPQPASVGTTAGTNATTSLLVIGAAGGNTSSTATGRQAGAGGVIALIGGTGGVPTTVGGSSAYGGTGGAVTIAAGTGGSPNLNQGGINQNIGGVGGDLVLKGGAGGTASGSGSNFFGVGGNAYLQGGDGQNTFGIRGNVFIAGGYGGGAFTNGNVYLGATSTSVSVGNVYFGAKQALFDTAAAKLTFGSGSTIISSTTIGVGTSSPWKTLSVGGDLALTGGFFDSLSSAGSSGYVLQSTGSATKWVATSTLGFGSVMSVDASGGTTGLSFSGGPITSSGTLTLAGTLGAANGGTGSTTLSGILVGNGTSAVNTLKLPSFLSLSGNTLSLNGALGIANGGTGTTTGGVTNGVEYYDGSRLTNSSNLTFNGTTLTATKDAVINGVTVGVGGGNSVSNTVLGYQALYNNTTGGNNTAIGTWSLLYNKTGANNVGIGNYTLYNAASATSSVAIGTNAGYGLSGNYHSEGNVFIGYDSGENILSGSDYNTLVGYKSGVGLTSGYGNTLVGAGTNTNNLTTGHGNIGLGYNTFFPSASGNNQLNIGSILFGTLPATTTAFALPTSGAIGIGTSSPFAKFSVQTNNGDTATTLFAIGSSTASATTTLFSIDNTGVITSNASATSTFAGALSLPNLTLTNSSGLLKAGAGGYIVNAVAGTDYLASSSLSATYPVQYSSNVLSLAFGTTTSNTWAGTQTFTNPIAVGSGTSTFAGNIGITGNIVPSVADTYSLGSIAYPFKDMFVGPGSLYVDGQEVVHTNVGDDVIVSADSTQNLQIKTSGGGALQLNPGTTGNVQLMGPLSVTAGKNITTTDSSALLIPSGVAAGNITLSGNVIAASNLNGGISITPNGSGSTYITSGNFGIGTTSPTNKLEVNGNSYLSGNATITGTATIGSLSGLLKASSGVVSAAVSGTDYAPATSGSSILYGNGAGGFSNASVSSPLSFSGGALSLGTVGVANGGTGSTTLTGLLKGNGTGAVQTAVAGTDYLAPSALNSYLSLANWYATTTDGLHEGLSNLYFTNARADARVAAGIAGTTTDALAQGSTNKYYSTSLFAANLAGTTTDALHEGTNNLYYTDDRVADYLAGSSTLPTAINYWTKTGSDLSYTAGTVSTDDFFANSIQDTGVANGIVYGDGSGNLSKVTLDPVFGFSGGNLTLNYGSGLGYSGLVGLINTGLLSLQQSYGSPLTGAITFATSSDSSTGLALGLGITDDGSGTFTFAPTLAGTLNAANGGTGSTTLSGLLKGNGTGAIQSAVAGTDYQAPLIAGTDYEHPLTFNYPLTRSTNAISLAFGTTTANSWSALQQFNGGASTTQFTSTGSAYLATSGGSVGIGTTSPFATFSLNGADASGAGQNAPATFAVFGGQGGSGAIPGVGGAITILGGKGGTNGLGLGGPGGSVTINPGIGGSGSITGVSGNIVLANLQGNVAVGTSSPSQKLSVQGNGLFSGNVSLANLTATGTITTSNLTVGTLNGPLQANNGLVSATSSIGVLYGGTGLTSAPTYGNILVGNSSGGYTLTATSSLGLGTGSVTSVDASGGTTGLSFSGGPITSSGTLTLAGTLGAANGGTGSTTLSGLLKGNGTGAVQSAVAGTDYITPAGLASAYPFPLSGNATSTLTQFNGGASTTQLTVSGQSWLTGTTTLANGNLVVNADGSLVASSGGVTNSFFVGTTAGASATSATDSNFVGYGAGSGATSASHSNFLGYRAGYGASSAATSNFIGFLTGYGATNASNSNFTGYGAGNGAIYAAYSNFIGSFAGYSATKAANSIFLGAHAGYNDTVNNASSTASTSIAIGQYAGTGGYSDSIAIGHGVLNNAVGQLNLGNVLYGTGIYMNDTQSSAPTANGKVGVGTTTPGATFAVQGNGLFSGNVSLANLTATGTAVIGTLNGPLQANNGLVSATSSIGVLYGGTGLTSAPTYGNILVGNSSGGYTLTATSSLGLGTGSVTSVDASGGTTGLSFSGGPITSSGTLTLAGTLGAANGGTGSTTLSGILKGNGTGAIQSAVAGTDYAPATSGSSLLYGNGAGGFSNASVSSPLSFTGGALSISKADGSTNGYLSSADWNLFNNKVSSTSLSATYPVQYNSSTGVFSLAFGTSTSNTWGGTQTFTSAPVLGALSGLVGANNGALYQIATSTNFVTSATAGTGISLSGSTGDITITNTGVTSVKQASGSTQTGALIFATSSQTTNGQTIGLNITNSTGTFTFAPTLSGTLTAAGGGTGQASYTTGDILYASGSSALSRLADAATGNVLISGGAGVAPSWGKVGLTTAVSGTLGVANGGTGRATFTASQLLYGNGTTGLVSVATSSVSSGTGISFTGTPGALVGGTALTITNTGVTSIAGTANQITASGSTGAVTLSIPSQFNIANASTTNLSANTLAVGGTATSSISSAGVLSLAGLTNSLLYANGSNQVSSASVSSPLSFSSGTLSLGTVGAANGGTGSTTLSGLLKGNGTGAIQSAVAGTDYQAPLIAGTDYEHPLTFNYPLTRSANAISLAFGTTTANSWSALQQFNGGASTTALTVSGQSWLVGMTTLANGNLIVNADGSLVPNSGGVSGGFFVGTSAGSGATSASNSNFLGTFAGYLATNASASNFLGVTAGLSATNASASNFLGNSAGSSATNASSSAFIGNNAGYHATNASHAIFIGNSAGNSDAVNNSTGGTSIAIGDYSGTGGYSNSIALGHGVINSATQQVNIGNLLYGTGIYNSDTQSSAPVSGGKLGIGTTTPGATFAVQGNGLFSGNVSLANLTATGTASASSLTLTNALTVANGGTGWKNIASGALVYGNGTGVLATTTAGTNGYVLQYDGSKPTWVATSTLGISGGANYFTNSGASTYLSTGTNLGVGTTSPAKTLSITGEAYVSGTTTLANGNFIVNADGSLAVSSGGNSNSFFVGPDAGAGVTSANNSNFIGNAAGSAADGAFWSNFLGNFAGYQATDAYYSNFFGPSAGYQAENASNSNFLGLNAGNTATNAAASNFIGSWAGYEATNAANSIFIGTSAGLYDAVDNTGSSASTSIAIGASAGTGGYSDSIAIGHGVVNSAAGQFNIGNVLYGSGIYMSDEDGTQSAAPTANGKVGVGTTSPWKTLSVAGDLSLTGALFDKNASSGTNGYILQSTGTGTQWVATSTLGLGGGGTNYFTNSGAITTLSTGSILAVPTNGWFAEGNDLLAYASSTNGATIFGLNAGGGNATTSATNRFLTAVGNFAGARITTGEQNTALGFAALSFATSSSGNTAVGAFAFCGADQGNCGGDSFSGTFGDNNTALGAAAGWDQGAGSGNTVLGSNAGWGQQNGSGNVAVGFLSAFGPGNNYSNNGIVAVGNAAGYSLEDGSDYNTLLGYAAGNSITSGTNNIFIGADSAFDTTPLNTLTTGSNNISIGYNITLPSDTSSNQLDIGNLIYGSGLDGTGTTLSSGNIGIGTTTPFAKFAVAGQSGADYFTAASTTATSTFAGGLTVGTSTLTILQNGKIGIGTTKPTAAFAVGSGAVNYFQISSGGSVGINRAAYSGSGQLDVGGTITADTAIAVYSSYYGGNVANFGETSGFIGTDNGQVISYNSTPGLGFFGATPVAKPSSTTDLRQALINLGLYTTGGATPLDLNGGKLVAGSIGVGTSSPYAKLSIQANNGDTATTLFAIGSSTASATTTLFNVLNNGNVGIGTTSPVANLGIQGSIGVNANQLYLGSAGNVGIGTNGLSSWALDVNGNIGLATGADRTISIAASTGGSANSLILQGGVRSGGNGAGGHLKLFGGTGSAGVGGNVYIYPGTGTASGNILLGTDGANIAGNIGIGTTTPSQKLSVQGNGLFSGDISLANLTATGTISTANLSLSGTLTDKNSSTGTNGYILQTTGTGVQWVATSTLGLGGAGGGSVTSVDGSGGTTGLTLTGGPITTSGTLTLGGTLAIANGGTGTSTAPSGYGKLLVSDAAGNWEYMATSSLGISGGTNYFSNSGALTTLSTGSILNVPSNGGYAIGNDLLAYASSTNGVTILGLGAGGDSATTTDEDFLHTTAIGYRALSSNAYLGTSNTAVGWSALTSNSFGGDNTAVGDSALFSNGVGSNNTALGSLALYSNDSGGENTALGMYTLHGNTDGVENTATGYTALGENTEGADNEAYGAYALNFNTVGYGNSAFGNYGLYNNITGNENVAVGSSASYGNLSATGTVAIGVGAASGDGGDDDFSAQGYTAIGALAGFSFDTGADYNTLVGFGAGANITTGAKNILIGADSSADTEAYEAGTYSNLTIGSNNIGIGNDISFADDTADNQLDIGNLLFGTGLDGIGTTISSGKIGIGTTTPSQKLSVQGNGLFSGNISLANLTATGTITTANLSLSGTLTDKNASTGTNGYVLQTTGTGVQWVATSTLGISSGSSGTVTSVDASGGTTGLTFSGGPITSSGTLTLAGTLGLANGGTNNTSFNTGGVVFSDGTKLTQTTNIGSNTFFWDSTNKRLGVGTSSPFAKFSIQANNGDTTKTLFAIGSSTASATTTLFSIDNTGLASFGDSSGTGDATFQFGNDTNAWSAGFNSADKSFTIASSTNLSTSIALTIQKSNLYVGIGTTTPARSLQVEGDIRTGTGGTNGCVENYAGTGLIGTCSSDARLKTVTGTVTNVLPGLASLDLVNYHWNQLASSLYQNNMDATNTGFIAQQVASVFPELVITDKNGYDQLNYTNLGLYGLEATRELYQQTGWVGIASTSATSTAATSTGPILTLDPATRNVGIATQSPHHTLDVNGDLAAKTIIVSSAAGAIFKEGTSTMAAVIPDAALADGGGVDLYKLATYTLADVQGMAARLDAMSMRMDSLAARIQKLEDGSIGAATSTGFSTSSLADALSGFGVFIKSGVAQFDTLVARQFVAATDTNGQSIAGSGTVLAGNTVVAIDNVYAKATSKILITMTSPVNGNWYLSDKADGGFRVRLSKAQSADVTFDYLIIQTEGQIAAPEAATSTPDAPVWDAPPDDSEPPPVITTPPPSGTSTSTPPAGGTGTTTPPTGGTASSTPSGGEGSGSSSGTGTTTGSGTGSGSTTPPDSGSTGTGATTGSGSQTGTSGSGTTGTGSTGPSSGTSSGAGTSSGTAGTGSTTGSGSTGNGSSTGSVGSTGTGSSSGDAGSTSSGGAAGASGGGAGGDSGGTI